MHSRSRAFAPPAMSPRLPRLLLLAFVWIVWPALCWGILIAWACGALGAEPVSNCTMTQTDDQQYYADCGPPSEPSHEHVASPS